jgi:hypothetical protein
MPRVISILVILVVVGGICIYSHFDQDQNYKQLCHWAVAVLAAGFGLALLNGFRFRVP